MDVYMCTDYYLIVLPVQIWTFKQEEPRYSQGSSLLLSITAPPHHGPTSISAGIILTTMAAKRRHGIISVVSIPMATLPLTVDYTGMVALRVGAGVDTSHHEQWELHLQTLTFRHFFINSLTRTYMRSL